MNQQIPPSIFNDVLGPVMRGPSSSHTAASVRIGRVVRNLLGDKPKKILFEFDTEGALATTFETQGSAIGLASGLLGWEITHPDIEQSLTKAKNEGIHIDFQVVHFKSTHPNTYKIKAESRNGTTINLMAVSLGGGMIEITRLNEFSISLKGDYFESLFLLKTNSAVEIENLKQKIKTQLPETVFELHTDEENSLVIIKSKSSIYSRIKDLIANDLCILWACQTDPVLPVLSSKQYELPFASYKEMLAYAGQYEKPLSELALEYESARAGISKNEVFKMMKELVLITKNAIQEGLSGTDYDDRILGRQSHLIEEAEIKGLISPSFTNKIIAYTTAIMEVKSSMGVIIAAPTAGSCGVLGGAISGYNGLDFDPDKVTRAFLTAGIIGVFIARDYTFAAEEGGCQVECGAASGMTAAALAEIMGGNYRQALSAASIALQNLIGLVCDPVANRVEVPCLGKNILGATNALNSATMSMAGFDEIIPLDQVIWAMKKAGDELPRTLCCTGLSGLSITKCSTDIYTSLKNKKQ